MNKSPQRMEAQLNLWRSKIDSLAAETHMAGAQSGFDAHIYVDELKALHAIAQATFEEYRAAGEAEQAHLRDTLNDAWEELGTAFKAPKPLP